MTTAAIKKIFLSRLILNPDSRQVWSELAQPYEMHKTLMRAFPKATDDAMAKARDEFGVLFRADIDGPGDAPDIRVYVQSLVEPDWSFLDGRPGYLLPRADFPNPVSQDISGVYQQLHEGQVLTFRLRANPTKRIGRVMTGDASLKGKRVGLLREEEQIVWLIRKGQEREKDKPGGFEVLMKEVEDERGEVRQVPHISVRPEGKQFGRKREAGISQQITHLAVRFDGLLSITDAEAFRESMAEGIGSAKAYGFGLMSLAKGPGG